MNILFECIDKLESIVIECLDHSQKGSGGGVRPPEKRKSSEKRGATGVLDVWLQLTA